MASVNDFTSRKIFEDIKLTNYTRNLAKVSIKTWKVKCKMNYNDSYA